MEIKNSDRIKFKKGKQSKFLRLAAKRVGSLRGLARFIGIPWGYFWYYLDEQITLPGKIFKKILPLTSISQEEVMTGWIDKLLPKNWGAIKGAIKTSKIIKKKLKENEEYRKKWIEKCKKGGAVFKDKMIKNWDIGFRKAGRRKVIGPKGEKMFNQGEKNIATYLLSKGIDYEYEPLIRINGRPYFPDFIVGNMIIERCGFITKNYADILKRKINDYVYQWKGLIIFVGPKKVLKRLKKKVPISRKVLTILEDNLEYMAKMVQVKNL